MDTGSSGSDVSPPPLSGRNRDGVVVIGRIVVAVDVEVVAVVVVVVVIVVVVAVVVVRVRNLHLKQPGYHTYPKII
jgi:hypothetical protein